MTKFIVATMALLAFGAIAGVSAEGPVDLTNENFDAEVKDSGKNAFIKFLAPW